MEELHKAAEIWKKNEKRNPKAAIYGLITQYGLAIALRLQGKREESQRELDRVLSRMEDAINKSDDPAAISDIRAQFAISLEKMAEGLLFDPISRPHPANVYFQRASRYVLDVPKNRQPMLRRESDSNDASRFLAWAGSTSKKLASSYPSWTT